MIKVLAVEGEEDWDGIMSLDGETGVLVEEGMLETSKGGSACCAG